LRITNTMKIIPWIEKAVILDLYFLFGASQMIKRAKKHVTSIQWNPKYPDLFAVGYGSYDFLKRVTGLICCYTIKNPIWPEYQFQTESDVMCLDFHPLHPALIAVGLYDGTVMVFDIRIKGNSKPIYMSTVRTNKHTDPVW